MDRAKVPTEPTPGVLRQIAAVGIGSAAVVVGGLLGVIGALNCHYGDCLDLASRLGSVMGWALIGMSPFLIARTARRQGWYVRGGIGVAIGVATFLAFRAVATAIGSGEESLAAFAASFGLASAVALPVRTRTLLLARIVGIIALSLIPAALHDLGVFEEWVEAVTPQGQGAGWEDRGWFLAPIAVLGIPVALVLPDLVLHLRLRRQRGI